MVAPGADYDGEPPNAYRGWLSTDGQPPSAWPGDATSPSKPGDNTVSIHSRLAKLEEKYLRVSPAACLAFAREFAAMVTGEGELEEPWPENRIADFAAAVEKAGGPWTHEEAVRLSNRVGK